MASPPVSAQSVTVTGAVVNGAASAAGGGLQLTGVVGQAAVGRIAGGGLLIMGGAMAATTGAGPVSVTSVSPGAGSTAGATRVTIHGSGFAADATVSFGGSAAPAVTVVDAATVIAYTPAKAAGLVNVAVTSGGTTSTRADAYRYVAPPASTTSDADGDGMPDAWELRYSLNPLDPSDASTDEDADGQHNLQEFQRDAHPHGFFTRYLAEGASSAFFDTQLALVNLSSAPSTVLVRYLPTTGVVKTAAHLVPAFTRLTVDPQTTLGTGSVEFSTTVESDGLAIVDRTMSWDRANGYGAHAESAVASPALEWYLAEGATHSGFNLFYLIQNAQLTDAVVEVTYLLPAGAPIVRTYVVPPASRQNIWVNNEALTAPALASTDVSAALRVTNGVPVIVERAMYLDTQGRLFGAGHGSAGVIAPALTWFLAEGATGSYLDLFILLANPDVVDAQVHATYLLPSGATLTKTYLVPARSRRTIWVDYEDVQLADTAVSTTLTVTNGIPILVERALWWPGDFNTWAEAHNSPGATASGTEWALADGEVGGARSKATYVLIANTSAFAGLARITLMFEDGTSAIREFALNANSRFNVDVGVEFPEAAGRRFGARVESVGGSPAQIVVERAMYWNALGTVWEAGTNAAGTRIR